MQPLADTGRVIAGRYRLQAPIGRGAMGVVWRARDQLLDRDVAVKEVHIADTLTDEERATAYQRTLREAKTAARLNHPAVVTVYDVAEDGGRPWIVMQLVRAHSLDQVLASSGPLSPRRAAEMARPLLSALSVAHRPDASAAARMITDVLPQLPDRPPGAPPGYGATALSASSRPASPGSVRPRTPLPGETAVDYDASAEQAMSKEPFGSSAANTGPPAGGEGAAGPAAPTPPPPARGAAPAPGP